MLEASTPSFLAPGFRKHRDKDEPLDASVSGSSDRFGDTVTTYGVDHCITVGLAGAGRKDDDIAPIVAGKHAPARFGASPPNRSRAPFLTPCLT
jgi:hypothetical protein